MGISVTVDVTRPILSLDVTRPVVALEVFNVTGMPVTVDVTRPILSLDVTRPVVALEGFNVTGIPDSSHDGSTYGRRDGGWVPVGTVDGTSTTRTAGETIGVHRVLAVNADDRAIHANNGTPEHRWKIVGISRQSVLVDETVVYAGPGQDITEGSWAWNIALPIYLTGDGLLTQTPPTTGFIVIVAFPTSATSLQVKLSTPISF